MALERTIRRGKQQVLFNYLPGSIFDHGRSGVIAWSERVAGQPPEDCVDASFVMSKVLDVCRAWDDRQRQTLSDRALTDRRGFALVEPVGVEARLFPNVFYCRNCGRVYSVRDDAALPRANCAACGTGRLTQMPFVRLHRCGALEPLRPPSCDQCHSDRQMHLDRRGSERVAEWRWRCKSCGTVVRTPTLPCRECGEDDRTTEIQPFRSGRVFYAHSVQLLNMPSALASRLLQMPNGWEHIAAQFLGLHPMALTGDAGSSAGVPTPPTGAPTSSEMQTIIAAHFDEIMAVGKDQGTEEAARLAARLLAAATETPEGGHEGGGSSGGVSVASGLSREYWEPVRQELLEGAQLYGLSGGEGLLASGAPRIAEVPHPGLCDVALVTDFAITNAVFGFSRCSCEPGACHIKAFPPDRHLRDRKPVFVDTVEADAIVLRLDPCAVLTWLDTNGCPPRLPKGSSIDAAQRAYFVELFHELPLRRSLGDSPPEPRLVFGLLHTLSHLAVKQASLFCGLERTSLAEYILPRSLCTAVYANHSFGATIGALVALFEQTRDEWIDSILDARTCIYDPVCSEQTGSCHACTHLSETSCNWYNLNLGRHFLFGGTDPILKRHVNGFFE